MLKRVSYEWDIIVKGLAIYQKRGEKKKLVWHPSWGGGAFPCFSIDRSSPLLPWNANSSPYAWEAVRGAYQTWSFSKKKWVRLSAELADPDFWKPGLTNLSFQSGQWRTLLVGRFPAKPEFSVAFQSPFLLRGERQRKVHGEKLNLSVMGCWLRFLENNWYECKTSIELFRGNVFRFLLRFFRFEMS